ncbi:hypothetical protein [Gymnodinialimonas ceratoperidinii]|uniref:Uncharacterized protein n=1 Tax=Gymnodinialimonas ceratoperidinii TaxID=2856823 RepID=A0A8F6Y9P0_9RHOB|nr:hypothetical protein [Gymnodinialimonas ceratoperidinii]QXT38753.1 hypothetical protein KYE46_12515 [Gymnodinialimonas ceratoperidinii]
MKKIALIAALTAAIAAPVAAQSTSTAFAIAHFNASADSASEVVDFRGNENVKQVSTDGTSTLAQTFSVLNQSADTPADVTGTNGATVVSGGPAYGADIFDRLSAED